MKTTDYYKKAIKSAENARYEVEKAEAEYERWGRAAKEELEAGYIGENGYKAKIEKLARERDAKIECSLGFIDKVGAEYAAEMAELGKLDGGRIDEDTMKLLNSGMRLTNEDWQELADKFRDNYVMTRILKERCNAARTKNEGDGLMLPKKGAGLADVEFGQTPQDRAENFSRFVQLLHYNAKSDSTPNEGLKSYASKKDFWNHCARESLGRMKPFGNEDFESVGEDFPVEYAQTRPAVW